MRAAVAALVLSGAVPAQASAGGRGAGGLVPKLENVASDKKFYGPPFPADYPDDVQPSKAGEVVAKRHGPIYPKIEENGFLDHDYVKDENGDGGEWRAQMAYDRARIRLGKEEQLSKEARDRLAKQRKEAEEAAKAAEKAASDAADAEKAAAGAGADAAAAEGQVDSAKKDLAKGQKNADEARKAVKSKEEADARVKELEKELKEAQEKFDKQEKEFKECEKRYEEVKAQLAKAKAELDAGKQMREAFNKVDTNLASNMTHKSLTVEQAKQQAVDAEQKLVRAKKQLSETEQKKKRAKDELAHQQKDSEAAEAAAESEEQRRQKAQEEFEAAKAELRKFRGGPPKPAVKSGAPRWSAAASLPLAAAAVAAVALAP